MQDWDDIRYFLALARTGSTTAAAKALGVNHSTVSRRIAQLEERMGARLFDRLASGVAPTVAGAALVEMAEQVERRVSAFSRGASADDARLSGRLVVTAPPLLANCALMPMLAAFSERHPEIDLEIATSDQIASLSRHEADVAIRATAAPKDTLMGHRLMTNANAVYCSQAYLDRKGLTLAEAGRSVDLDWIWHDQGRGYPLWVHQHLPQGRLAVKVDGKSEALSAARIGMGVVEMPVLVGQAIPDLVRLPGWHAPSDKDIWILYHRDFRRTARVRAFVADMRQQFRTVALLVAQDHDNEQAASRL
jgi:DNA-binding transcriptional LysR family regulator